MMAFHTNGRPNAPWKQGLVGLENPRMGSCSRCTIVNQAQIQEELGVSEVVGECVCEGLDTHRRLDTERLLHHT